jgi:hypothetical protein
MTNHLAQTESLYLRKHAENPIDWWPWCPEALETARRENKPIFLSIGYSSCHWCTVMEGEAFSNQLIADYMNANFLPIKVDREERPDIDSIYMQALQIMTGQGGWPLNIFLTPDRLIPFFGGTYFSVEPKYGRPGFLQILQAIRRYYDTDKAKLQDVTQEIMQHLQQSAVISGTETIADDCLSSGVQVSTAIIGDRHGRQSFPMIPYSQLVLQGSRFNLEAKYNPQEVSIQRGYDLALGGIYDHVAGGFHRYTVDPNWTVPHFEKMLYDNGQIVEYLANLWSSGVREPAFKRAVFGTVQWLKREMTAPEGYFYAAQDADSFTTPTAAEPEEGAFYVWLYSELEALLTPEELAELKEQFTVTANGNFEGQNVLQRRQLGELSHTLEAALAKLFQLRYGLLPHELKTFPPARDNQEAKTYPWPGRIPSVTDPKMIVAWNSLMISGLATAAAVFDEPEFLELANNAANFICDRQWIEGRFHRLNYEGKTAVLAQSEDYALFIKALIDLHQVSLAFESAPVAPEFWLETAVKVQAEFDEFLWSIEMGGYYNTATDSSDDLIIRERSYMDNATPAANGIAAANLVRLAFVTEDLNYLDRAEQILQAFSSVMERAASACPSLFVALDWFKNHTLVRSSAPVFAMLNQHYFPTAIYKIESDIPAGSVGLVCQGFTCEEPAKTEEQLLDQLQASQTRYHSVIES